MNVTLTPAQLKGMITPPTAKNLAHLSIIAAALSNGVSTIGNISLTEDVKATVKAMKAIGAEIEILDENSDRRVTLVVQGNFPFHVREKDVDLGNSLTSLRLLSPLLAISNKPMSFKARGKVVDRALDTYYDVFFQRPVTFPVTPNNSPLTMKGGMNTTKFSLRGDVSYQYLSGLLLSLPLLKNNAVIEITSPLEIKEEYMYMTIQVLKQFGVSIAHKDFQEFYIYGGQEYKSISTDVENDYSQAAFWLCAGAIGHKIICKGMNPQSVQDDKYILHILEDAGASIMINKDRDLCTFTEKTKGFTVEGCRFPNLIPILGILGACSQGTTIIKNSSLLRQQGYEAKLQKTADLLYSLDGQASIKDSHLVIEGKSHLRGGWVDPQKDYHIAMAAAVASIRCNNDIILKDPQCTARFYPSFWSDFNKLGGIIS